MRWWVQFLVAFAVLLLVGRVTDDVAIWSEDWWLTLVAAVVVATVAGMFWDRCGRSVPADDKEKM